MDESGIHTMLKDTYPEFERLFAVKEIAKEFSPREETKAKTQVPNLTQDIILKAVKLNVQTIQEAIQKCDLQVLNASILSQLLLIVPTDEELQIVSGQKPGLNYASAEKFMINVSSIEYYEMKLRCMHFIATSDEIFADLTKMVVSLSSAVDSLKNSVKFREFLRVILAIGNYMNSGQKGGAFGFRVGSLLKINDTKSVINNRKHTLLNYLVDLIRTKFPHIADFPNELRYIEEGSKSQIRQGLNGTRDNLEITNNLIVILESENQDPLLMTKAKAFYSIAKQKQDNLEAQVVSVENEYESLVISFGEEGKHCTPEEFFGTLSTFIRQYKQAEDENMKMREKEKADETKEIMKKANEDKRRRKREETGQKEIPEDKKKEDGLDDLISSIRSGKAFGEQRRRAPTRKPK